ncbi:uncharacterized protein LOC124307780 isoform X1 [Neodiprion virginianus]|uniref:uncharacterized protein LOC124307780 isoform X1 n=1 Tax=Neodiprion virginianus TaxID=2961670 RepID=UPI001EE6B542|nr:uncharacterized protein LOC124307780 isoform X1 [Neodiprion virginianus]XP_046625812.1 uncharacterized protein LOC124307780 isoform X1 [Neodiprion virginianus]XP_046625822.1 uncharacterized protein LOC124307780 isoform X1 [Neodiprion virginianus]XP_046625832.1 uncharacterized protein LOC124307780 isoform X1 [Neodiprion virginianus]
MDWITVAIQVVTVTVLPIWIYLWLNKSVQRKLVTNSIISHYTIPGWNFHLKRCWAEYCINGAIRKKATIKKKYDIVVPKELEELRKLSDEDSSDSIQFYGIDQKGNFVFISLTRRRHRTAELILQLSLADGRMYQLPNHPDSVIFNNVDRGWSAVGLKITPLEPWRRWRITFNGLLRNGIKRNYRQNEGKVEHVRFHFIYTASAPPLLWPKDWSPGLQADALAREPWKNPQWINMIKLNKTGGFDQWGTLAGQLIFEDSSSTELYLRGLRQRRWGVHKPAQLHRTVDIVGVMYDGTMYCLGADSSKEGLTHMKFGHIRQANDIVFSIDQLDFDLGSYAEQRENIPTRYKVNFRAGGRKYSTEICRIMDSGATLYGGRPWDWEARVFNTEIKLNNDTGYGIAYLWYNYNGPSPLKPVGKIPHLLPSKLKPEVDLYTVSFKDRICQSETAVGGKGSSIALLTSIPHKEFIVPLGFCITTAALNLQIEKNEPLANAVTYVKNVSAGILKADLKVACEKAVALFEQIPIIEPIQAAIRQSVSHLDSDPQTDLKISGKFERFAVRSSAVGEDSEDTSAAGQNATFLGLKGVENIIKAVAKCWGSLYAYQSVEYRRQRGQPIKAEMGVCVQQMVNAETAGVMFTRHPTSGDPREILITANYGLGESVVSAMIEPDTVIVKRSLNNALAVKDLKLGKKTHKVSMTSDEGTVTEELKDSYHNELCISEETALKLSKLGIHLEALFGSARDIEWAVAQGKIFLLQARPVTALDNWSDFEIIHELDSPVPSEIDTLVFSNAGEVFPGATSPLTLSTVVRSIDRAILLDSKFKPTHCYCETFIGITGMRCCINYMNTILREVESKISLSNKIIDIAICGHEVTTPELHAWAVKRNGIQGIKSKLKLYKAIIRDTWVNGNIEQLAKKFHANFKFDVESYVRAEHLYKDLDDSLEKLLQASIYHAHTSKVSVFCQIVAMSVLTEGAPNLNINHYSDVGIFLSSCSDVVSAQVPTALRNLANTIRNGEKAEEFVKLDPKEARDWLTLNCTAAAVMFDDFLKEHGYRCIRELDLMTETWDMKPEKLISSLQAAVASSGEPPVFKELSVAETVDRLRTPKSRVTKKILEMLIPLNRSAVSRREFTKAVLVSTVNALRLGYQKLGRLMVEDGQLPDMNLIFFLTHQEIGLLFISSNPTLVQKAIRRQRLYPHCDKIQFPEVNRGVLKPILAEPSTKIREGGARVSGTPVGGGTVLGRACIITNINDAVQLKPGDILITQCTDIGWSPYFPILGGVVTELGGLISHGAVVAREYGLPCIVGAEGATQKFRTGDIVLLTGTTGILHVVEETT